MSLSVPKEDEQRDLVNMAAENAAETLAHCASQWLADAKKTGGALVELQEDLDLPALPRASSATTSPTSRARWPVGSMVVFENGVPKNGDYRRFKIKTVQGANDFAMLQEVLRRRFKRFGEATAPGTAGKGEIGEQPPEAAPASRRGRDTSKQGGRPGQV